MDTPSSSPSPLSARKGRRLFGNSTSDSPPPTRRTKIEEKQPSSTYACVIPNTDICKGITSGNKISKIVTNGAEIDSIKNSMMLLKKLDPEMKLVIYPEDECTINYLPVEIMAKCKGNNKQSPPFTVFTMAQGIPILEYIKTLTTPDEKNALYKATVACFKDFITKFHNQNYLHGDIRIDNIVIFTNTENKPIVKLIDYTLNPKNITQTTVKEIENMRDILHELLNNFKIPHRHALKTPYNIYAYVTNIYSLPEELQVKRYIFTPSNLGSPSSPKTRTTTTRAIPFTLQTP